MRYRTPDQEWIWADKLFTAALAGIATLCLFTLLSVSSLSTPLMIAVFFLSIAIPSLGGFAFILEFYDKSGFVVNTWYKNLIGGVAWLSGFASITCVVWHFSWIAGVLFLVVSFIVTVACIAIMFAMMRAIQKKTDADDDK